MSVGDRTGRLSTCHLPEVVPCPLNRYGHLARGHGAAFCHLSESSLDLSGILYHANCIRPISSQRLHLIEQSPVDKQVLGINDAVSILVHVHPSDPIGNETRQTR
ncbi:hypothetical protein AVEN_113060-1 [Araneus ventricosus]|uniref:Uncharacterized protein n=1 Tax=Araneus ventricosus TaxID=182803 RepID=A0A4Y2VMH0_ARAVE|nr:hypothetical protein AVEN_236932-1 [Araneus ventricosus]GBO25505.1 hypothetical protein AVEN_113060-1 [Araneus ventricosus]